MTNSVEGKASHGAKKQVRKASQMSHPSSHHPLLFLDAPASFQRNLRATALSIYSRVKAPSSIPVQPAENQSLKQTDETWE